VNRISPPSAAVAATLLYRLALNPSSIRLRFVRPVAFGGRPPDAEPPAVDKTIFGGCFTIRFLYESPNPASGTA